MIGKNLVDLNISNVSNVVFEEVIVWLLRVRFKA